jgi:hypothetical protein
MAMHASAGDDAARLIDRFAKCANLAIRTETPGEAMAAAAAARSLLAQIPGAPDLADVIRRGLAAGRPSPCASRPSSTPVPEHLRPPALARWLLARGWWHLTEWEIGFLESITWRSDARLSDRQSAVLLRICSKVAEALQA